MLDPMSFVSAHIVIRGPEHNGTRLALREGITSFGRLPSNDVILLGDLVSRHHARIIFFDGKASIQDLGSHNGSWVNGDRISTRALDDNDTIRIGNFKITVYQGSVDEAFTDEATADQTATDQHEVAQVAPMVEVGTPAGSAVPELPDGMSVRDPSKSAAIRRVGEVSKSSIPDESSAETLQLLFRIAEALSNADDVSDYLHQVLSYTLERIEAETAVVFRLISGQTDLVRVSEYPGTGCDVSMGVVRWTVNKGFTVFSRDIQNDLRFRSGASVAMLGPGASSLVCSPVSVGDRVFGAVYLARAENRAFSESEVDAIEAICHLCAAGIERIELRDRLHEHALARDALERFHSPDVVERILEEAHELNPEPGLEARSATVCFADIPGFTKAIAQLPVDEVSLFLNDYVETMCSIVFAHRGTVNTLAGDRFIAVFGAPFSYGNDAARAVKAALEMRAAFERLVEDRSGLDQLGLRLGMASGEVLSGTVGSPRRMDYTVLGGPVRLSSRIHQVTRTSMIVVCEATYELVGGSYTFRRFGKQTAKVPLYEVIGRARPARGSSQGG